jgi:hypothetical protein
MQQYSCRFVFLIIQLCLVAIYSGCSNETQKKQSPASSEGINLPRKGIISGLSVTGGVVAETVVLSNVENLYSLKQDGQTHSLQDVIVFSNQGRGVAYIAEHEGKQRVIHNGQPGNPHTEIAHLSISPDGRRVSYRCSLVGKQQMVSDGVASQVFDEVRDTVYSPDSRHIAYYTKSLDRMRIVLDGIVIEESSSFIGKLMFTNDSSKLVYTRSPDVEHQASLVILDLKSGAKIVKECLDTPIVMNSETDRIAAAVKVGKKERVIDFAVSTPADVHESALYDTATDIDISSDGKSVSFIGSKGKSRYLVLNGKEERLPVELAIAVTPVIRPDRKGAAIILTTLERYNRRFMLHQVFHSDGSPQKRYDQIQELVYCKVNSSSAFVAKRGEGYFAVVNGNEGPEFDKVVSPMFSPDGRKLVYRARKDNKRFVVVADLTGKVIRTHPEYEMVFPAVFTADGKSVAYGVKDGNQLVWKVEKL